VTEVLIVLDGVPARPSVLADTVARLHAGGARVTLAAGCPADRITVAEDTAEVLGLPTAKALPRGDRDEYQDAVTGRRLWVRARNDARVRDRASSAYVPVEGDQNRSEERRVGKECRSRWSPYH